MSWFRNSCLYPYFVGLYRSLLLVWRCIGRILVPLCGLSGRTIRFLGWKPEEGRRERDTVKGQPEVDEEGQDFKRPHLKEPVTNRGVQGFHTEPPRERLHVEEERHEENRDFDSAAYRVETTDEFYCDYDSTWETEESEEGTGRTPRPANSGSVSIPEARPEARCSVGLRPARRRSARGVALRPVYRCHTNKQTN